MQFLEKKSKVVSRMMTEGSARRQVVLLGIGHTNAHVLRMWRKHALPNADLICISNAPVATYSGMLPAVLSGQVPEEKMQIDLARLCSMAKARLIIDRAIGLDHHRQELLFESRPPVQFDVLSVGIGSKPSLEGVTITGETLVKIKPMQDFLNRLRTTLEKTLDRIGAKTLRVVVVGGGVAGVEILFCLRPFLRKIVNEKFHVQLVTRSDEILGDVSKGLKNLIWDELQKCDAGVTLEKTVTEVTPGHVGLDDGSTIDADLVIWATSASAPDILKVLELPLSDRGFFLTDRSLQSVSGAPIFGVGDCASIAGESFPKSGVYAVRQGPVLWQNIQNLLVSRPLEDFQPQSSFMKLINLGDRRAVGEWRGLSFRGRWVLWLKHFLDHQFMKKHTAK